jgi:hypothetical protein
VCWRSLSSGFGAYEEDEGAENQAEDGCGQGDDAERVVA